MKLTDWLYSLPARNSGNYFSGTVARERKKSKPLLRKGNWYDQYPHIANPRIPQPSLTAYERKGLPNFSIEELEKQAQRSQERNMKGRV